MTFGALVPDALLLPSEGSTSAGVHVGGNASVAGSSRMDIDSGMHVCVCACACGWHLENMYFFTRYAYS